MELYRFTEDQRSTLESMRAPVAICQLVDKRAIPLILTDGFCELFGYEDRAQAYRELEYDMLLVVHPDDAARVMELSERFEAGAEVYDIITRARTGGKAYRVVHACGRHMDMEDGARLIHLWYTDEGSTDENGEPEAVKQGRQLSDALRVEGLLRSSLYDHLTGLPNMTCFFDFAEAGKAEILAGGSHAAMLYINLVGMKFFNDRHGFTEGDKLLRSFAVLLVHIFGSERCCRASADQFLVYAPETGLDELMGPFFRECRELNGGNSLPVRVGIYSTRMGDVPAAAACDRAKLACDSLQGTYASAYSYYHEKLSKDARDKQYIIENLDRALEERWIEVYYQPIVRATNGRVCDEEALARWNDPVKGFLSPALFIPFLEEAGLITRLDLYMLDRVLEDLRLIEEAGLTVVPHSVNLSRMDFSACDIVEEVRRRVDAAGIPRATITIEITESTLGSDFEFIREQVIRFRKLGFPVWMDDFGTGYSSLDVLQSIRFDLLKFDMRFMQDLEAGESGRIILSELMKMATSLGIDTLCEGVETESQVRFLREIGCSKLQGYYFCRPIPPAQILERYRNGTRIGFENPAESGYYEAIGRVNLYDYAVIAQENLGDFHHFFNMLPMGIIEVRGKSTRFVRSNQSYRDFIKRFFGFDLSYEGSDFTPYGDAFMRNVVKTCCEQGTRSFYDEKMPDGSVVHSFARRIGINPVDGTIAVAIVVLSITGEDEGTTYAEIARALAADYYNIYYVDTETDRFIEYSSSAGDEELAMERHGERFFQEARDVTMSRIYEEDRERFLDLFTKENILRELDEQGMFTITYRLIDTDEPLYVNMKIMRMQDGRHIILGISLIDAQMKQQELIERFQRETAVYTRLMALSGDYLILYTVNPVTNQYFEFSASPEYETLGLAKTGEDFFRQAIIDGRNTVFAEDLPLYETCMTRENILRRIEKNGAFQLQYRILLGGMLRYALLKIVSISEPEGERLIAGVSLTDKPVAYGADNAQNGTERADAQTVFQALADSVDRPCAVISVEKNTDVPAVRIVCANSGFKNLTPADGMYYDGMLYYDHMPRNPKFEDFCYHAAILGESGHVYVEHPLGWIDQMVIPLKSDNEALGYCQFTFELTETVEPRRLATVSVDVTQFAVRSSLYLMSADDFKEGVRNVLQEALDICGAHNSRIFLLDHENRSFQIYCEVRNSMGIQRKNRALSYHFILDWEKCIGDSNALLLTTAQDFEDIGRVAPEWLRNLRSFNVQSLVLLPLRRKKKIFGFVDFINFDTRTASVVKELAELLTVYLAVEISNHQLMDRLEEMSTSDALTGLRNRAALLRRMESMDSGSSFGVINLDLNGLKIVNDTKGHDAGDRLLVAAAEMLKKIFYAPDIFRTGGDEFIVLIPGITRESFDMKLERFRAAAEKYSEPSFAMGAFWSDGSVELTTAFRLADNAMYQSKKEHYRRHPEQRRT